MRKIDVEIVFVVLVYRNIDDLQNFIINTKSKVKCNYKIIVIDAKYSDEVSKDIENICFQNKESRSLDSPMFREKRRYEPAGTCRLLSTVP